MACSSGALPSSSVTRALLRLRPRARRRNVSVRLAPAPSGGGKSPARLAKPFTATFFVSRDKGRLRSGNCWRHPAQRAGRTPRHSFRGRWLPSPRIPIRYRRSGSSGCGGIRLLFFRRRSRFWRVAPRLVHSETPAGPYKGQVGVSRAAMAADSLRGRDRSERMLMAYRIGGGVARGVCGEHIRENTVDRENLLKDYKGGNAVCSRVYTRPNKNLTDNGAERRRKCPQGHTKRAHARASSLLRGV